MRTLSPSTQTTIKFDSCFDSIDFYTYVARAKVEELCSNLFHPELEPLPPHHRLSVDLLLRDAQSSLYICKI